MRDTFARVGTGGGLDDAVELRGFFYNKCIKRKVWFVILWQRGKYVLMTFCVMVGPFTLAHKLVALF